MRITITLLCKSVRAIWTLKLRFLPTFQPSVAHHIFLPAVHSPTIWALITSRNAYIMLIWQSLWWRRLLTTIYQLLKISSAIWQSYIHTRCRMTEVQICKGNISVILIDYMCLTPIHNMVTKSTKENYILD